MLNNKTDNAKKSGDNAIVIIAADNTFSKEENNKFFDSLFACKFPLKIIVQRSMLENGNFPLKYLDKENVLPLHGDDFIKERNCHTYLLNEM